MHTINILCRNIEVFSTHDFDHLPIWRRAKFFDEVVFEVAVRSNFKEYHVRWFRWRGNLANTWCRERKVATIWMDIAVIRLCLDGFLEETVDGVHEERTRLGEFVLFI